MREKEIEKKLKDYVKSKNGECFKFVSPGIAGVPDRIVLMNGGKIGFVELKKKGKKPRPIQVKVMNRLQGLGFLCFVIDDVKQIEGVIYEIQGT